MNTRRLSLAGLLVAIGLFQGISTTHAVVIFDDGGVHIVNSASDNVAVFDGPGGTTTNAVFLPGADVSEGLFDDSVVLFESSTSQILGGNFQQDVVARDGSVLTITGGTLQDDLFAFGASTVNMTGGTVADNVKADDVAVVQIFNGALGNDLMALGSSTITMFGGSLADDVETDDFAIVQIFGGSFAEDIEASGVSIIHIFGGNLGTSGIFDTGFGAEDAATINLYGSNFLINGSPAGAGPIAPSAGFLSGVLSDGASFNNIPFIHINDGEIVLHATTPEPTSAMLLWLGAAAVVMRRRRIQ